MAGFFTKRNHTRRGYYNYLRNQVRSVQSVSSSPRTSTLKTPIISVTTKQVPFAPSKGLIQVASIEDDNILKVPDDIDHPPPGLGDATAFKNEISAASLNSNEKASDDATSSRKISRKDHDKDNEDATAINPRVSSLFNWQRTSGGYQSPKTFTSVSGYSSSRLGQVGHGSRAKSSRLRSRPSRKQTGARLPGVKYMVYTGELNNLN